MLHRVTILLSLVVIVLTLAGVWGRTAIVQSAQPEQYTPKSLVNATQEEVASDIMSFVKANFDSPGVEPRILRLEIVPYIDYLNWQEKRPFDDENGRVKPFEPTGDPKRPMAIVLLHGNFISKPNFIFGGSWGVRGAFLFLRIELRDTSGFGYIIAPSREKALRAHPDNWYTVGYEHRDNDEAHARSYPKQQDDDGLSDLG